MPHRRRAVKPPRNLPPVAVDPRISPLAPTVLPTSFIPTPGPPKLPPRPVSNHPSGTLLTVPTFGPLPPPPVTVRPAAINNPTGVPPSRRPFGAPPPGVFRRPNVGVPVGRAPIGRVPVYRR